MTHTCPIFVVALTVVAVVSDRHPGLFLLEYQIKGQCLVTHCVLNTSYCNENDIQIFNSLHALYIKLAGANAAASH